MMHSFTTAGSMLARLTTSRTATAPSLVADRSESEPWNFPIGVRTPAMMTISSVPGIRVLLCEFQPFIIRCRGNAPATIPGGSIVDQPTRHTGSCPACNPHDDDACTGSAGMAHGGVRGGDRVLCGVVGTYPRSHGGYARARSRVPGNAGVGMAAVGVHRVGRAETQRQAARPGRREMEIAGRRADRYRDRVRVLADRGRRAGGTVVRAGTGVAVASGSSEATDRAAAAADGTGDGAVAALS